MSVYLIPGSEVAKRIKNLLHKDTQVGENQVYLTVKNIYNLKQKGALDFSGKEQTLAKKDPVPVEKKSPDDKYGWWHLDGGSYLVEFNEQIEVKEGEVAILKPREELLQSFCSHPLQIISGGEKLSLVPLKVGSAGIDIKQNARISAVRVTSSEK